jgi:hypothetical protein
MEIATQQQTQIGFFNLESYQLMERIAERLSQSSMIPAQYQAMIEEKNGKTKTLVANPSAIPNMIIALNMAQRMKADPLMIMQNLHAIEGRPAWSSVWIIAQVNNCGRFSPLQFDFQEGQIEDIEYSERFWNNQKYGGAGWDSQKKTIRLQNDSCQAFATDLASGRVLKSVRIDMAMAVREGWYGKNGSKWQTMRELMLTYRSASFFGKVYAPELLMGLPSREEMEDIAERDITAEVERVAPVAPVAMPESKSSRKTKAAVVDQEHKPEPAQEPPASEEAATVAEPVTEIAQDQAQDSAPLDGVVCLTSAQVGFVNRKILNFGIDESVFCAAFGVQSVEQLPASKVNEALKWIDENKGA